jgi:DNA repair protein RadD
MKPRQYQTDAVTSAFKYLDKYPEKHPLIALPTGSGKSLVMRMICEKILFKDDGARIVIVSHEREILKQNYATILGIAETGIYSAGLESREIKQITIAGIQSIFRVADLFRDFDYVLIDEAHTIPTSENSMYRQFFQGVGEHTRIGLTATPFRLGEGYITGEDHMFDKIVIDLTFGAKFTRLIKDGFICDLVINSTQLKLDTTDIHMQGGDFSLKEMSQAFDRDTLTWSAISEMVEKGKKRKKWLIFAIDIDHADNICDMLIKKGIRAMVVHSRMEFDRDFVLDQYRSGELQAIVNVGMLTTGFDAPDIDLIGMLRPTKSPNLHVQTIGRGLRIAPGKKNCLVLDYAGNTERIGPINRIKPYKKQASAGGGEPITKTCPDCDTITYPMEKICKVCGHEFVFKSLLELQASAAEIISEASRWYNVDLVTYAVHKKLNSKDSIKVSYSCGLGNFKEWICPEHRGYAREKSIRWLKKRGINHEYLVNTIMELEKSKSPSRIRVNTTEKYPQILEYDFTTI